MSSSKQVSVRLPLDVAERLESKGHFAPYIIEAVKEKLRRDDEAEIADGFALLAASPEMWDMNFPTGGQRAANSLLNAGEPTNAP